MSRYCEQCGTKLDDHARFCEKCGAKITDEDNLQTDISNKANPGMSSLNNQMPAKPEKSFAKRCGKVLIIITLLLIVMGLLGYFVVYPKVSDYLQSRENQKEADKVITMIDSFDDEDITIDSGEELEKIKDRYDSLSKEQKKLVTNYSKLKKAHEEVETIKNQQIADQIIADIDQINPDNLTAEDTSVQECMDKYNDLSDAQKALVTNADKLDEYEDLVQRLKDSENSFIELVCNLKNYHGRWAIMVHM